MAVAHFKCEWVFGHSHTRRKKNGEKISMWEHYYLKKETSMRNMYTHTHTVQHEST